MNLLPSMPNGFNQILIAICIAIIYFANQDFYASIEKSTESGKQLLQKQIDLINSNDFEKEYQFHNDSIILDWDTMQLAKKQNQLTSDLKMLIKKKHHINAKTYDSLSNIISKLGDSIIYKTSRLLQVEEILQTLRLRMKIKQDAIQTSNKFAQAEPNANPHFGLITICMIIILFSLIRLLNGDILSKQISQTEVYKNRTYKYCQSCAKYFSPKLLHGKEKDGSINIGFCNECYSDGQFTNPQLTTNEVVAEIKMHNRQEKDVDRKVNQMVRWNQNPYVDNYKF